MLFEDRGYSGHLEAAFAATLDAEHISYLSSHAIAPASDAANFIADGHFTPEIDRQLAALFLQRIRALAGPPS